MLLHHTSTSSVWQNIMLTIVTWNIWKYTQISEVLNDVIETRQEKIDLEEIQTADLRGISADKAMKAFDIVQGPILVDDTGIVFDAYPWFPWALTKFLYEGVWLDGMKKMYTGIENKKAEFVCVLSYMDSSLDVPIQCIGTVEGKLTFDRLDKDSENPKLPYDLIFKLQDMQEPVFYHMDLWKSEKSHRYKASVKMREWLESY